MTTLGRGCALLLGSLVIAGLAVVAVVRRRRERWEDDWPETGNADPHLWERVW